MDYAGAGSLLAAYARAWQSHDGDAWTALFTDEAEYHVDPFRAPLVGHNALRAMLLDAAETQRDVDVTIERHWVSGSTVLAAWHATWTDQRAGGLVRVAGFLTADTNSDGRIERMRQWMLEAPGSAG